MKSRQILLQRLEKPSAVLLFAEASIWLGWWGHNVTYSPTHSEDTYRSATNSSSSRVVEAMCMRWGGRQSAHAKTNRLFMSFRSVGHTGYMRWCKAQSDMHKHAAQKSLSFRWPPSDIITSSQLLSFLPTKRVFVTGNNATNSRSRAAAASGAAQLRAGMHLPVGFSCHFWDH